MIERLLLRILRRYQLWLCKHGWHPLPAMEVSVYPKMFTHGLQVRVTCRACGYSYHRSDWFQDLDSVTNRWRKA